jgi:hypothetical protein
LVAYYKQCSSSSSRSHNTCLSTRNISPSETNMQHGRRECSSFRPFCAIGPGLPHLTQRSLKVPNRPVSLDTQRRMQCQLQLKRTVIVAWAYSRMMLYYSDNEGRVNCGGARPGVLRCVVCWSMNLGLESYTSRSSQTQWQCTLQQDPVSPSTVEAIIRQ